MPRATSDGVQISYDDQGQGEPALLCLPGWCSDRSAFRQLASRCSARRRTLALDWRGHGESGPAREDFGNRALVQDALSVIEASGAGRVVPVAMSHAGWVAIELRRALGARIPRLVLLDWLILTPPAPFLSALDALQRPEEWEPTREQLFSMWLHEVDDPELIRFVRQRMGAYGFDMWSRAGREISAAYAGAGSPLQALARLEPPVPALHVYAQPDDAGYLAAQQAAAATHPWFSVRKLSTRSHFPMIEVPDEVASTIEQFVA